MDPLLRRHARRGVHLLAASVLRTLVLVVLYESGKRIRIGGPDEILAKLTLLSGYFRIRRNLLWMNECEVQPCLDGVVQKDGV